MGETGDKLYSMLRANNKGSTPSLLNTKDTKDSTGNSRRFNNFMEADELQPPRQHSPLEQSPPHPPPNETAVEGKGKVEEAKHFFSPRGLFQKQERGVGMRQGSPSSKFESLYLNNTINTEKGLENPNFRTMDRNYLMGANFYQQNREGELSSEPTNCLAEKRPFSRGDGYFQQAERPFSIKNSTLPLGQFTNYKEEAKHPKKVERAGLSGQLKNLLNPAPQGCGSRPGEDRMKLSAFLDARVMRPTDVNRSVQKHEPHSKEVKAASIPKIINRPMRFGDCLSLIHYCRLCYKFAGLLDEYEGDAKTNHFLTNWSIQLLGELNRKIEQGEVVFKGGEGTNNPDGEKKKKLKNVVREYMNKYAEDCKLMEKRTITLK
jgi:hypothetical protein